MSDTTHFLYVEPKICTVCGEDLIDGTVLSYNVISGIGHINLVCPTGFWGHDNWQLDPYNVDENVWESYSPPDPYGWVK